MAAPSRDIQFGERLRARREKLGWNQEQLGRLAHVTKATVSKWENGQIKNMRPQHLFAIADGIGLDARFLALGDYLQSGPRSSFAVAKPAPSAEAAALLSSYEPLPIPLKTALLIIVEAVGRPSAARQK